MAELPLITSDPTRMEDYTLPENRVLTELWSAGPMLENPHNSGVRTRIGYSITGEVPLLKVPGHNRFVADYLTTIAASIRKQMGLFEQRPLFELIQSKDTPKLRPLSENGVYRGFTEYRTTGTAFNQLPVHSLRDTIVGKDKFFSPDVGVAKLISRYRLKDWPSHLSAPLFRNLGDSIILDYEKVHCVSLSQFKSNHNYKRVSLTQGVVFDVASLPKKLLIVVDIRDFSDFNLHDNYRSSYKTEEGYKRVIYNRMLATNSPRSDGMDVSDQAIVTVKGMNGHVITIMIEGGETLTLGDDVPRSEERWGYITPTLVLLEGEGSIVSINEGIGLDTRRRPGRFIRTKVHGDKNVVMHYIRRTGIENTDGECTVVHDINKTNAYCMHRYREWRGNVSVGTFGIEVTDPFDNKRRKGYFGYYGTGFIGMENGRFKRDSSGISSLDYGTIYLTGYDIDYVPVEYLHYRDLVPNLPKGFVDLDPGTERTMYHGETPWENISFSAKSAFQHDSINALTKIKQVYKKYGFRILNEPQE